MSFYENINRLKKKIKYVDVFLNAQKKNNKKKYSILTSAYENIGPPNTGLDNLSYRIEFIYEVVSSVPIILTE